MTRVYFFSKQSTELVAMEVVWDKSFPSRKWGLEAIFFQKQRTENGGGVERRKRRPSSQPQLLVAAV